MTLAKEFKAFVMRGNVVDMAVGIIVGAGFGKIVSSLVNDVLLPPIGLVVGGVDFSALAITIKDTSAAGPAVLLKWGLFVTVIIDFLIVAFVVFLVVKAMNAMLRRGVEPAAPTTKPCPQCLMEVPIAARRCGHCTSALA